MIESYGPLKAAGAQLASHLCYDETLDNGVDECGAAGRTAELAGVSDNFADGAKPWHVLLAVPRRVHRRRRPGLVRRRGTARATRPTPSAHVPDPRRVPGNAVPFHLRLSNKDVAPETPSPGGERLSMLVDWVAVQVKYPTAAG